MGNVNDWCKHSASSASSASASAGPEPLNGDKVVQIATVQPTEAACCSKSCDGASAQPCSDFDDRLDSSDYVLFQVSVPRAKSCAAGKAVPLAAVASPSDDLGDFGDLGDLGDDKSEADTAKLTVQVHESKPLGKEVLV